MDIFSETICKKVRGIYVQVQGGLLYNDYTDSKIWILLMYFLQDMHPFFRVTAVEDLFRNYFKKYADYPYCILSKY